MKVLLAVDGSKYTKRMLRFLAAHDEFSRPVVPAVPPRARGYFSAQDLQRYYAEEAREVTSWFVNLLIKRITSRPTNSGSSE